MTGKRDMLWDVPVSTLRFDLHPTEAGCIGILTDPTGARLARIAATGSGLIVRLEPEVLAVLTLDEDRAGGDGTFTFRFGPEP